MGLIAFSFTWALFGFQLLNETNVASRCQKRVISEEVTETSGLFFACLFGSVCLWEAVRFGLETQRGLPVQVQIMLTAR